MKVRDEGKEDHGYSQLIRLKIFTVSLWDKINYLNSATIVALVFCVFFVILSMRESSCHINLFHYSHESATAFSNFIPEQSPQGANQMYWFTFMNKKALKKRSFCSRMHNIHRFKMLISRKKNYSKSCKFKDQI